MGGYGAFVWSAYSITFVVLAANLIISNMNHKRMIAKLQRERAIDSAATNVGHAARTRVADTDSTQQGDAV